MTPERWAEVQAAFHHALDLGEAERTTYLAELRSSDADLAQEVARMLDANDSASRFAEPPDQEAVQREMNPADYLQGRQLGDFILQEELGRGGMGVVFRAIQQSLDREVAIKVLPPALASSSTSYERFRREAIAASRLDHSGLAQPIHFGEAEGMAYIAMRLVEGPNLADLLRAHRKGTTDPLLPQAPKAIATFIAEVLDALHHVHSRGLIHRDVKPGNLILTDKGPVLIDFGLAKDLTLEDLSHTGVPLGTPYYMSPEQVEAKKHHIDRRTDVYSVGVVLYELLVGRPPFTGTRPDAVCSQILQNRIPRPAKGVPKALETITLKATSGQPSLRYQTAAEMAADLRRFVAGQAIQARPLPLIRRVGRQLNHNRMASIGVPLVLAAALTGYIVRDAGIPGSGLGLFSPQTVFAAEKASGQVSFDLSRLDVDEVAVRGYLFTDAIGGQSLELELKGTTAGDVIELAPGKWRFQLTAPGDRTAELVRTVDPDSTQSFTVLALGAPALAADMVTVPTTGFIPGAQLPNQPPDQHFARIMPDGPDAQAVAAFAIGRTTVTNRQFQQGFQAAGMWPPQGQSEAWYTTVLPDFDAPPTPNWLDLPVTQVTFPVARTFAELSGGRLPTMAEHLLVTQLLYADWQPERSNLLGQGPSPDMTPRSYADYLEFALPADSGPSLSPLGIKHWFGNVTCYVEAAVYLEGIDFVQLEFLSDSPQSKDAHMGGFWGHGPEFIQASGCVQPTLFKTNQGSPEVGFRIARSL